MDQKDKCFYVYDVTCDKCSYQNRLPEMLFKEGETKVCHSCWDGELKIVRKLQTNEINHGKRLYDHILEITGKESLDG